MEELFKVLPTSAEKDEYVIVCGNYKASNRIFKKIEEAEEYIESKPWELILTLIGTVVRYEISNEGMIEQKNEEDQLKNHITNETGKKL